jgi:nitrate/TMAO reductase-like tetraheme cytochrome c subunit
VSLTCYKCGLAKDKTLFVKCKDCKEGIRRLCKECNNKYYRERRKDNPELVHSYEGRRRRDRHLKHYFGITEQEYLTMLEQQNNNCAICHKRETQLHNVTKLPMNLAVDHCHTTKKVRGLLCSRCNKGIGLFYDDVEALQEAIKYINERK